MIFGSATNDYNYGVAKWQCKSSLMGILPGCKYSHFGLKCDTNLRNNYESLHQWWCQGERTSSIFLMR
jgi:hypothetical protein